MCENIITSRHEFCVLVQLPTHQTWLLASRLGMNTPPFSTISALKELITI